MIGLLILVGLGFAAGYVGHVIVVTVRRCAEMQRYVERTRRQIQRQYGDDELEDLIRCEERKIRAKRYQE